MALAGIICLGTAAYGLWSGAPVLALGFLLLGLGLAAAGVTFLLGCYFVLAHREVFLATLFNRLGLLLLGPAAALIFQPWREIPSGTLTPAQCLWVCLILCGASILPCGISLVRLGLSKKGDKKA